MATFEGTIVKDAPPGQHYRPRHGHPVKWMRFSSAEQVYFLNTSKPYVNNDRVPRWGGGDYPGTAGLIMMVGRGERQFGEAHDILAELFQQNGITDPVTEMEMIDFACMNGPNEGTDALGSADWLRLTGKESPVAQEGAGTVRNPILVADDRFPPNHKLKIDGKWYMNDLREGKGRFPDAAATTPTTPTIPPTVPTEPAPTDPTPNPPTRPGTTIRTVAIDYRFDKALEFPLPPGTTRVHFNGQLLIAAAVKPETRSPILKTAVGPEPTKGSGRRRFNVGSPVVNASGGRALEWAETTEPVGGGRLPIGQPMPFSFTWTAGVGSTVIWNGRSKKTDPLPNLADQGGIVVFGINQTDDPKADYVPLAPGSRLVGTLTIEAAVGAGGTQPGTGPIDPGPGPVEPLPSPSRLEEAVRAAIALLNKALEGKS